ncbi:MAG: helix-hairpin-helix domain-containing protein [Thermomicrobiales bacterium]
MSAMTTTRVTNQDAAEVLFNVATILELAEDNPYRVRAYRRAARLLLRTADQSRLRVNDRHELDLPGLGPRLRRKLGELLHTGQMRFYVELCADLPREVASLMEIPTIGPKTARRLHEELGLATAADVVEAAHEGKIRQLYGFGEKRERQLLAGAEQVLGGFRKVASPMPLEAEDDVIEALPAPRTLTLLPSLPEAA